MKTFWVRQFLRISTGRGLDDIFKNVLAKSKSLDLL